MASATPYDRKTSSDYLVIHTCVTHCVFETQNCCHKAKFVCADSESCAPRPWITRSRDNVASRRDARCVCYFSGWREFDFVILDKKHKRKLYIVVAKLCRVCSNSVTMGRFEFLKGLWTEMSHDRACAFVIQISCSKNFSKIDTRKNLSQFLRRKCALQYKTTCVHNTCSDGRKSSQIVICEKKVSKRNCARTRTQFVSIFACFGFDANNTLTQNSLSEQDTSLNFDKLKFSVAHFAVATINYKTNFLYSTQRNF